MTRRRILLEGRFEIRQEEWEEFCAKVLKRIGHDLVEELKRAIEDVGAIDTGYMYRSFRVEVGSRATKGRVVNLAEYSGYVDQGMPPMPVLAEDILGWVHRKKRESGDEAELAAYRVARKLSTEGYVGRQFVPLALERLGARRRGIRSY